MSEQTGDTLSSDTLTALDLSANSKAPSYFQLVVPRTLLTPEVRSHHYAGLGTKDDPYVVEFLSKDPGNPMSFSTIKKWTITVLVAFVTLAVAFVSSAYSGGVVEIAEEFHTSEEVATLGVSLKGASYSPRKTLGYQIADRCLNSYADRTRYGRQIILCGTYCALTAFNAGAAGSKNIESLLVLRFFAGAFGSSALTNSGGVIADMFPASERGLAMSVFAAAGPIVGGFVGETVGWRWLEGIMAILTGALWIIGSLTIPETYAPLLLRNRAAKLSQDSAYVYLSKLEVGKPKPSLTESFKTALSRPWILLIREPIVLLLSVYMVYQKNRHWSQGVGSLPFLSVLVGMLAAVIYTIPDNKRYQRAEQTAKSEGGHGAPPEARLPPCMVGSVCLPIGLFVFAWTNYPRIHWIVSVMFTAPFGFGMVLLFLSVMNYLIDAYTIYAASVLAANSVLRSIFGAVFPLFTSYMYDGLGIHWASSIPAFLALVCVPFPFLFYRSGPAIRMKCKFARTAAEMMEQLQRSEEGDDKGSENKSDAESLRPGEQGSGKRGGRE
ncbi:MAG: hypothetical protein Q9201_002195 [Fulgogasparrea decipioides]